MAVCTVENNQGLRGVMTNQMIIVSGGAKIDSALQLLSNCDAYSVHDKDWKSLPELKTGRMRHGSC